MMTADQLTVWASVDEKMDTQWGHISYFNWCIKEAERFRLSGRKIRVARAGSTCALFNGDGYDALEVQPLPPVEPKVEEPVCV